MPQVDIVVIGLGVMGGSALWNLAARGADVLGLEQFEVGHDYGSSHGETRIIRTAYFEGPHYVPLVQRAFVLWRELAAQTGLPLLTMTGALMVGQPGSDLIEGATASARQHNLEYTLLASDDLAERFPQFAVREHEVGLLEEQGGYLRPDLIIPALVDRATALGARVLTKTPVTALKRQGDRWLVRTADEEYSARHVVLSAGAWTPRLLPQLSLPLQVERQIVAYFPVNDAALFAPGRMPVFIYENAQQHSRYGFPSLDGATIKVGVHHEGAIVQPDAVDRQIRAEDLEPLAAFVGTQMSGVERASTHGVVCLYTNTPDNHFMIGSLPDYPEFTLLSPCSGHGFKFGIAVGEAAAELALQGQTSLPIDSFAPARYL